jgi:hypothetical protein
MKYMRRTAGYSRIQQDTAGYTPTDYETNTQTAKELKKLHQF